MHGDTNWSYVIEFAPCSHWVFQDMKDFSHIVEFNRILDETDKTFEEEGSSMEEEISYYSSTSASASLIKDFHLYFDLKKLSLILRSLT